MTITAAVEQNMKTPRQGQHCLCGGAQQSTAQKPWEFRWICVLSSEPFYFLLLNPVKVCLDTAQDHDANLENEESTDPAVDFRI